MFFGGGNNRPTFPFIDIPREDGVGSSLTEKDMAFFNPWLQAKLGANLCSKLFILRKSCIKRKKIRDNGKQIKNIKILLQWNSP